MTQTSGKTANALETVYLGDTPAALDNGQANDITQLDTLKNPGLNTRPHAQPDAEQPAQISNDGNASNAQVSPADIRAGASDEAAAGQPAVLPLVDIVEDESGITLLADLPGVSRERLTIKVTGDNLLIEGAAAVPSTGEMELIYSEVRTPHYRRSFTLSRELDPTKIDAKLANGVLKLRIPKSEQAMPRRIQVNVG